MIVIVMIITGAVYISPLLNNVIYAFQNLSMDHNNISDDGMAKISKALQQNKSLTTLSVGGCGLSVEGTVVCIQVYSKNLIN